MQPGIEEEYKKQTVKKRSVGARAKFKPKRSLFTCA